MKNIHVLSTDKPSRLVKNGKGLLLVEIPKSYTFFGNTVSANIYITSDEEIKEGDWCLDMECFSETRQNWEEVFIYKSVGEDHWDNKKIILTTDQDLIDDGVQAIDDDFLEWFVKNPSCEFVETIYGLFNPMGRQVDPNNLGQNHSQCIWKHKIIIPREEPKQERKRGIIITHVGKQETLEEAAEKWFKEIGGEASFMKAIEFGTKWQQEQEKNKYNEEEVDELLDTLLNNNMCSVAGDELIEQFKKK
jgi:hypothetical protein